MRRRRVPLLLIALVAFLLIAFGLARFLTVEGRERDAIYALLSAQAAGDGAAVAGQLAGCDARCGARAIRTAARLRRAGKLRILRLDSATAYALGSASGATRVVWSTGGADIPVVQCVSVRRKGSVLAGQSVTLVGLSAPIPQEGSC